MSPHNNPTQKSNFLLTPSVSEAIHEEKRDRIIGTNVAKRKRRTVLANRRQRQLPNEARR